MTVERIAEALDEMGERRLCVATSCHAALTAATDTDLVDAVCSAQLASLELHQLVECAAKWSHRCPEIEAGLKGQVREDGERVFSMWLAVYELLSRAGDSLRGEP